jgi:LysM repeat protein
VTWQHYRIRRGDSLIRIARRFDTEVGLLRRSTTLRGNLIRAGDTLMIPDSAAWQTSLALADGGRTGPAWLPRARGDSLYKIARASTSPSMSSSAGTTSTRALSAARSGTDPVSRRRLIRTTARHCGC